MTEAEFVLSNMTFEISSLDTSVSDPWSPYSDWQANFECDTN